MASWSNFSRRLRRALAGALIVAAVSFGAGAATVHEQPEHLASIGEMIDQTAGSAKDLVAEPAGVEPPAAAVDHRCP
jgi:hypothetical protein